MVFHMSVFCTNEEETIFYFLLDVFENTNTRQESHNFVLSK
jgi:hypothetical protein